MISTVAVIKQNQVHVPSRAFINYWRTIKPVSKPVIKSTLMF